MAISTNLDSMVTAALLAVEQSRQPEATTFGHTPLVPDPAHQARPPQPAHSVPRSSSPLSAAVAVLRAQGPAAFDALLARYDALADGPEREALALLIDAVAAQRYAHVSRLY